MIYFPFGYDINTIEGAVPGSKGEVRLQYRKIDSSEWQITPWEEVDSKANFSRKFILNNLESGSTYSLLVEARPENGGAISAQIKVNLKPRQIPKPQKK